MICLSPAPAGNLGPWHPWAHGCSALPSASVLTQPFLCVTLNPNFPPQGQGHLGHLLSPGLDSKGYTHRYPQDSDLLGGTIDSRWRTGQLPDLAVWAPWVSPSHTVQAPTANPCIMADQLCDLKELSALSGPSQAARR